MSISFEITMAIRYLRAKNMKSCSVMTLFSVIGIAIGVSTLIVVMSLMNGFREKLLDLVLGIDGHINVCLDKNPDYNTLSKLIMDIPGVLKTVPVTSDQVIIEANGNIVGSIVCGIETKDLLNNDVLVDNMIAGDIEKFDEGIIIGARIAEHLNINYGDNVTLMLPKNVDISRGKMPKMQKYKVVGIFDLGVFEYNNVYIYMPLKSAQAFFNYGGNIRNIEVFVKDINRSDKIAEIIEEKTGMHTTNWKIEQAQYFDIMDNERSVMFLILALIIVVAALNIISNMMIMVQAKKSAIAIMKTFGAENVSIMRMFCICGLLIGFIGTLLGCIMGVVFTINIENIRIFLENIVNVKFIDPTVYFFSKIPVMLLARDVISTSMLAMCISFLATIIPALQAAAQDPAEILRYE